MDKEKTGALIAAARKEYNMTPRQLADALHVSDRAVSKWERGAGFPDVSLLEPLAAALDLHVLDLLRGERTAESDVHAAVGEALAAFQEKRRRDRRDVLRELAKAGLFLLIVGLLLAYMVPLRARVDRTVTAGVYRGGALIAYTDVELQGDIEHTLLTGHRGYWGRFAIGCVEWTCREQVNAGVTLHGAHTSGLSYSMPGVLTGDLHDVFMVIDEDMREFAFALSEETDGTRTVLATSPEAYNAYRAGFVGWVPPPVPELRDPHPERLLEFPTAWRQ